MLEGARKLDDGEDRGVAMFSRSPATQHAYEVRLDELFAGDKPRSIQRDKDSALVLDASDILDLLKQSAGPCDLGRVGCA